MAPIVNIRPRKLRGLVRMCMEEIGNEDDEYYDEEIDEYCGPWSDLMSVV